MITWKYVLLEESFPIFTKVTILMCYFLTLSPLKVPTAVIQRATEMTTEAQVWWHCHHRNDISLLWALHLNVLPSREKTHIHSHTHNTERFLLFINLLSPFKTTCLWDKCSDKCTAKTQRDRVEREVGGGIGMGNTCKSMADSCQCVTKPTAMLWSN